MDDLLDNDDLPRHERELTLNTGAILGIFLGLVVLCGGFFGFGYNMGRKSAPKPLSLNEVTSPDASFNTPDSGAAKPAAGSPMDSDTAVVAPPPSVKPLKHPAPVTKPADLATSDSDEPEVPEGKKPAAKAATALPAPAPIVRQPAPVSPAALNPSAGITAGGTYLVQVAAVSHQEDADLLVSALRARGYGVTAHGSAGDKFIHVQVGPFRDKKDADAMRQRLLADGYNAIVKQ